MLAHEFRDFGRVAKNAARHRLEDRRLLRPNGANSEIAEARLSRGEGNGREELLETLRQHFVAKVAAPDTQIGIIRHFAIITVCGISSESGRGDTRGAAG